MATQILKDSNSRKIGELRENGVQTRAYDVNRKCHGWYDSKVNATYDANGKRIANSNVVSSLLFS